MGARFCVFVKHYLVSFLHRAWPDFCAGSVHLPLELNRTKNVMIAKFYFLLIIISPAQNFEFLAVF